MTVDPDRCLLTAAQMSWMMQDRPYSHECLAGWRCKFRRDYWPCLSPIYKSANFVHTMKALISYHVSATLIVIENRNNGLQNRKLTLHDTPASPMYSISFIFAVLLSIRVHSIAVRLGRAIMHQHTKIRLKSGANVFEISIRHHVEFWEGQNFIWKWDLEN